MITKDAILEYVQTSVRQPISVKELIRRMHVASDDRHQFKRHVQRMVQSGDLVETQKQKIALPAQVGLLVGHLQMHRNGFGFVVPQDKTEPDVYIKKTDLGNALHGDLVVARPKRRKTGRAPEGQIVRVLQHGQERVIGIYQRRGRHGVVVPEDPRFPFQIFVAEEDTLNAQPHQVVVVRILRYREPANQPVGAITDILGFPQSPGLDEKRVIHTYDLPTEFPPAVLEAAAEEPARITDEEIGRRTDLRDLLTFTIDGENARDFDDAVSLTRLDNGNYHLGVHIADVSFYVAADSLLDQEAYQRGTSVYFPDRAIPMLPERLSNDLCSLRQGQDRLTISVFMEFDPSAKLVKYNIAPSVIHSRARMTYTRVRQMLKDRDESLRRQYAALLPTLELMQDLSRVLLHKREQRGSLDFDLPEPEIVLDVQGRVENIIKAERNLAHRIIEEFMIAANETVASHLAWMQVPSLYRVHDRPSEQKVANLTSFLNPLGIQLQRGAQLRPKDLQRLLTRVRGKPIEHLVNNLALRAMKQAMYAVKNEGHFGLASPCYTHFTSPIRRYPDLIVHRVLRDTWRGAGFTPEAVDRRRAELETIAEHSSLRERMAMEAERDIVLIKKLRFMEDKVGEVFQGIISGVAPFGLFVELQEYFVEGLIHVTTLHDDYYTYHEETYSLVGEQFRQRYRVGDRVTVQVASVDVAKRQMDLMLGTSD